MTSPTAPPTPPQYIADGLPKQEDQALRDASEFIDELLAAHEQRREQPVFEDELPADAEIVEEESSGAVYLEYRTCGDETCSCMSGGQKHGPYKYRAYRDGNPFAANILEKRGPTSSIRPEPSEKASGRFQGSAGCFGIAVIKWMNQAYRDGDVVWYEYLGKANDTDDN